MDFSLRSVARQSPLSGRTFEPGDGVESFLFRQEDGELERVDLHQDEVGQWQAPGAVLCRWRHKVRDRDDADANARRSALLSAEELFFALLEAEASSKEGSEAAEVVRDRRVLLTLLALLLERRRAIKARRGGKGLYWHPGTKRELRITPMNLTPEEILSVQEQLADLV